MAPNTDPKVHDRLWVAVAALILGALCDEGQGPCVDLLRVVGVLPVGLSLVTLVLHLGFSYSAVYCPTQALPTCL